MTHCRPCRRFYSKNVFLTPWPMIPVKGTAVLFVRRINWLMATALRDDFGFNYTQ